MFEKSKFSKKYSLISSYIKDKQIINDILKDNEFQEFYKEYSDVIPKFISNLKLLYSEEEISNIINDIFKEKSIIRFKKYIFNLSEYIKYAKEYDNGSIDILKGLKWEEINGDFSNNIEGFIIDKCFKKYYLKPIYINEVDVYNIFIKTGNIKAKKTLLMMAKNNNLDFFASVMQELSNRGADNNNLSNILEQEINEKVFSPVIKEKLGEELYQKFIIYYFNSSKSNGNDKKIIDKILEQENYTLLQDIMNLNDEHIFARNILENEVGKDIFSLSGNGTKCINRIVLILYNYLSPNLRLNKYYLNRIKSSISNEQIYEEFYNKHREVLNLFQSISFDSFSKLSVEEQRKIYNYIKSLGKDEKQLLVQEIQEINSEINDIYKGEYSRVFKSADSILDKAQVQPVIDSEGKKHEVKVYELKNNEGFTFLITAMHKMVRDGNLNMYNRPAHKETISNPENFCRDLQGGAEMISTSMINDTYIGTFVGTEADIMYVFSNVESEDVLSICPEDGAYPPTIDESVDLFTKTDPVGPEELIRETKSKRYYNEVAIRRKKKDGQRILPTAILCYDKINDASIKHAEYFGIPIIVINTKTYDSLKNATKVDEEEKGRHM
ncbi:MAG TPA: hypothetical protein PKY25_00250 [Bacilli bacterium]|nr:hypothetical protein [Bacilli bacterium]